MDSILVNMAKSKKTWTAFRLDKMQMEREKGSMPRKSKRFKWGLFMRNGVWYADGRSGEYNLGKHSLSSRIKNEAEIELKSLDRSKAIELGMIELNNPGTVPQNEITIEKGFQRFFEDRGKAPLWEVARHQP